MQVGSKSLETGRQRRCEPRLWPGLLSCTIAAVDAFELHSGLTLYEPSIPSNASTPPIGGRPDVVDRN